MHKRNLLFHIAFSFLISFIFLAPLQNALAQCDGVYFETIKTQKLDQPILLGYFEDLNGDNKKDILGLQTGANYIPTALVYYKRTNDGFETTPIISNMNIQAVMYSTAIADVNGDGAKDFIARFNTAPQSIFTFINDGNGNFTPSNLTIASSATETISAAADINADGKADLITVIPDTGILSYRLGQADSTFASPIELLNGGTDALLGDFNNDNKIDIVARNGSSIRILYNLGNGVFSNTGTDTYPAREFPNMVVDMNNDGKLDLVTGEYPRLGDTADMVFSIFLNSAKNTFTRTDIPVTDAALRNARTIAKDFDGNGTIDIGSFKGSIQRIHFNDGNANFTTKDAKRSVNYYFAEDFNSDQKADFIQLRTSIFLKDPNTGSPLSNIVAFEQNVCEQKGQTNAVDFNGDGATDLGLWKASTGDWRWITFGYVSGNPYPYIETTYNWGLGSFGDTPVANDYDGDGKTDYAIYRRSTGQWWVKKSSDNQTIVLQYGLSDDIPVPADYDNDGIADFAVYRPSLGNWYIWYSSTNSSYAAHFGIEEDIPLPADFDGDGKADLAVYRPSTGVWYHLKSSSGNQDFSAVQFGISTDIPVPADYDSDGIADLAVFRDGVWYFYLSSDNSVKVIYYGIAGDIPFAVNYPAGGQIGRTSLVIFRPGEERFYAYENGYGYYNYYPFGNTSGEQIISSIIPIQ